MDVSLAKFIVIRFENVQPLQVIKHIHSSQLNRISLCVFLMTKVNRCPISKEFLYDIDLDGFRCSSKVTSNICKTV